MAAHAAAILQSRKVYRLHSAHNMRMYAPYKPPQYIPTITHNTPHNLTTPPAQQHKTPSLTPSPTTKPQLTTTMCFLTLQTYACGHTKDRSLASTYAEEGVLKHCHVARNDALGRSCGKVAECMKRVPYRCVRCMGSLNWGKDYQEANGWHGGRYLKGSSYKERW